MTRILCAAALAVACIGARTQPAGAADADLAYRTVFEGYKGWTAPPQRDWREVNHEAERLGGHAGHLRAGPATTGETPGSQRAKSQPSAAAGTDDRATAGATTEKAR